MVEQCCVRSERSSGGVSCSNRSVEMTVGGQDPLGVWGAVWQIHHSSRAHTQWGMSESAVPVPVLPGWNPNQQAVVADRHHVPFFLPLLLDFIITDKPRQLAIC